MSEQVTNEWQRSEQHVFWGEIAPADHVVQVYESEEAFLDLLENYASGGFKAHECVIIIAGPVHLHQLTLRLKNQGFNIPALSADEQFIALDAEEVLLKFMKGDWPDEALFHETISAIISRAQNRDRRVRAFGEMVAILWARGMNGATVQLEQMWNRFCESEAISLFCAYPKSGFTSDIAESMQRICNCHTRVISEDQHSKTELLYKTPEKAVIVL